MVLAVRQDLLATGAPSDWKEAPMLVAHPSLGTQLLGAVEAPLREPSDLRDAWPSTPPKRAVAVMVCTVMVFHRPWDMLRHGHPWQQNRHHLPRRRVPGE